MKQTLYDINQSNIGATQAAIELQALASRKGMGEIFDFKYLPEASPDGRMEYKYYASAYYL